MSDADEVADVVNAEPDAETEAEAAPEAAAEPAPEPATDVAYAPEVQNVAGMDSVPEAVIIEGYTAPGAADAGLVEGVSGDLTWIPFAGYMGLWIVLVGLTAYFLWGATAEQPARWMSIYVPLLWSGVALTALGPVLSLVVWLFARTRRSKSARRGLFASAMTRGALIAFFGVAMWLATLFVLEVLATGGTL